MREIKFRARNAETPRCWIYGYFIIENGICYISNNDGKFRVIAGMLNQYTGLKDKNGKEIYEGDIIHVEGTNYYEEVAFNNKPEHTEDEVVWGYTLRHPSVLEWEIVGNICENSGLLKEGK